MLCRILKTRIKHRYFTRGKSFESGTSLAASCAHELRYQTAKSCAFFLERRKFEERTRWKRRVSKTLVLCRGRFRSGSVPNPQNQSDLQSKVSNRFWTPCAKCNACAKCKELGAQIRGWCTFSRLHLTGEFCLRISIRWRSMVRCTFSRVRIFAGTPGRPSTLILSIAKGGVENVQYTTNHKRKGGGSARAVRSARSASHLEPGLFLAIFLPGVDFVVVRHLIRCLYHKLEKRQQPIVRLIGRSTSLVFGIVSLDFLSVQVSVQFCIRSSSSCSSSWWLFFYGWLRTVRFQRPLIATKIVPGRVCPRTRQQLHARACGFFFHVRR